MRAKRLLGHALVLGAGALSVVLALSSGEPDWFERTMHWMQPAPHALVARSARRPGPFGAPVTVTPQRPLGNDSSVSSTPLPLILVRTQPGRNNREGFAQIGVNARSPQTYGAGAILANGARLTEVYPNYVVLERDGRSVRLYLHGQPQPDSSGVTALLTVGGPPAPVPALVKSEDHLTAFLRPTPVFADGRLQGYSLQAGRNSAALETLGLKPGDVLTQINGSPVSSAADSLGALATLAQGAALSVVIEREGVSHALSLDGANLVRSTNAPRHPLSFPTDSPSRSTRL